MNIPLIIVSLLQAITLNGAYALYRFTTRGPWTDGTLRSALQREYTVIALVALSLAGQIIAFFTSGDSWSDPLVYFPVTHGVVGAVILMAWGPLRFPRSKAVRTDSGKES